METLLACRSSFLWCAMCHVPVHINKRRNPVLHSRVRLAEPGCAFRSLVCLAENYFLHPTQLRMLSRRRMYSHFSVVKMKNLQVLRITSRHDSFFYFCVHYYPTMFNSVMGSANVMQMIRSINTKLGFLWTRTFLRQKTQLCKQKTDAGNMLFMFSFVYARRDD